MLSTRKAAKDITKDVAKVFRLLGVIEKRRSMWADRQRAFNTDASDRSSNVPALGKKRIEIPNRFSRIYAKFHDDVLESVGEEEVGPLS